MEQMREFVGREVAYAKAYSETGTMEDKRKIEANGWIFAVHH